MNPSKSITLCIMRNAKSLELERKIYNKNRLTVKYIIFWDLNQVTR